MRLRKDLALGNQHRPDRHFTGLRGCFRLLKGQGHPALVSFQFLTQRTLPIFFLYLSFCVSLRLPLDPSLFSVSPLTLHSLGIRCPLTDQPRGTLRSP
jgi:hypothetical protein